MSACVVRRAFIRPGRFETSRGEVCQGSGTNSLADCSRAHVAQDIVLSRGQRNTRAKVAYMLPYPPSLPFLLGGVGGYGYTKASAKAVTASSAVESTLSLE